ncbi:HigA family addiction module antitoxin [Rubrivirga sp. S365]|uniref:HigA family addiction module antitoxin n=1 Tax=Rubrivirga sp. S365 TaxID=3076080 RepID=UPI0028C7EB90|nr:HigA family addiction module antitoxin [Rubrivirga sp. S365]MDT7858061.1 HigA family addiction module antitoxin [Rubrivirga sp. S365]
MPSPSKDRQPIRAGDVLHPVHPGEVLAEEFLGPLGLSQNRAALAMRVPARRVNEIVHGKRSVTADTALRLARYFGTTPEFWVNLQAHYDLEVARDASGARIASEVMTLGEAA